MALNNNFPSKDAITSEMLTGELITKFHSNYDYVKAIDAEVPLKSALSVGMRGVNYIAALNQNCQKIVDVMPYDEYNHTIPDNRGSEYGMLLDIYYEPSVMKLASGNTLIGCISRGGETFSRENFNIIGNIGSYSEPNSVGFDATTEGTYDSHGKAVYIEKSGIIYCFHEALDGVSLNKEAGHNSDIVVKKSEDNGATWVEITRIDGLFAYPKVFLIDGNFYLLSRKQIGGTNKYISLYKSTNNCITWTELMDPYVGENNYWSYNTIPAGITDELHIILMERVTIGGSYTAWPRLVHIRSTDAITWYNNAKTWSKNVVESGSITRTEGITNCLITTNAENNYSVINLGSFVKNGKLYMLVGYGQPSLDVASGLTKVVFDSCKLYEDTTELLDLTSLLEDVTCIGYSQDNLLRLMRNGDTFDILWLDTANSEIKLLNYNNTGLLSTKLLKVVADMDKIKIGSNTANVTTRTGKKLVLGKLTGSMLDLEDSYSDLIIFENS